MFARVTLLEIDTLRVTTEEALERFRDDVLPRLREQAGYAGAWALTNAAGPALVMSLWETEEDADRALQSGFYQQQLGGFATVFREPPGRTHYAVALVDAPQHAA